MRALARAGGAVGAVAIALSAQCSLLTDLDGLTGGKRASDAGPEGGGGPVVTSDGQIDLIDDDGADFNAGTFDGTAFTDGHLVLAGGTEGRFVSRVHDAGREVTLAALRWTPSAPYGKILPNGRRAESGYARGAFDMGDNVLLFHFDRGAGKLNGVVADASGDGNSAEVRAPEQIVDDGVLRSALRDGIDGYIAAPVRVASGLNFGVTDFTWMLWVRTTQACPIDNPPDGNRVYMGMEETSGDRTHLWFGCHATYTRASEPTSCPGPQDGTGRAGGTWCSYKETSDPKAAPTDCRSICGRTPINDGKWHHLAIVKRGHAGGTLRLFVDGKRDADDIATSYGTPIGVAADVEFAVGAFSNGTAEAAGDFDEVAVFRRALSDEEIAAAYLRGSLAASLRVRVCGAADCSDAPPFAGPSPDESYVDPQDGLAPPDGIPVAGLPRGRFVQYEVTYHARAVGLTPEVSVVAIRARP